MNLPKLENAILFFHAQWSSDSIAIIRHILTTLNKFELGTTERIMINWDNCVESTLTAFIGKTKYGSGNGETVFIKNGSIVYKHFNAYSFNNLYAYLSNNFQLK